MTVKQFDKLSKNKKAVLVAQDVLAQLEAEKYIAHTGNYIDSYNSTQDFKGDIKEQFDTLEPCGVCALGSMLLSATHLGNKLTFDDLSISCSGIEDINNLKVISLFNSIFKPKQLLLIETAFEGYNSFAMDSRFGRDVLAQQLTVKEYDSCNKFFEKYRISGERLTAICNNIIRNSGTFVL